MCSSPTQPLTWSKHRHANYDRIKFLFTDCTAVLTEMLLKFREVHQSGMTVCSPHMALKDSIIAYDQVLLGMPAAMCMNESSVRSHLVWKRMLTASADGHVKFKELTEADIKLMSCGGCHDDVPLGIPSWLAFKTLASQIKCPIELLFMWRSLWRDALVLGGAASAIVHNSQSITHMLNKYVGRYSHPPSPRSLLLYHLQGAEGGGAGTNIPDAEGGPSKRPRAATVGALRTRRSFRRRTHKAPAEAPAEAPAKGGSHT
jgi:hypothetical protein